VSDFQAEDMLTQIARSWRQARVAQEDSLSVSQDSAKLTALLQTYRADVVHFLYRMLQDGAIAEELAMEVFLRLYRSRRPRSPIESPARLFRIATDLALGELQNAQSQPAPEQIAKHSIPVHDVSDAVASMPGKQRAAVVMHKYHHMDFRQISTALNCSESAARSLLLSAYECLRQRLTPCVVNRR
jgi:RNA polymerase sigma-70 factor (ECF subfamily)